MNEELNTEDLTPEERQAAEHNPIIALTDEQLASRLRAAIRNTLLLGVIPAAIVWISSGWRNAVMLLVGALISAASIYEWKRLILLMNARLDGQKAPRGAAAIALFFVLRLTVYAVVIYGSLKCFQGSVVALLCGLSLAVLAMGWEVVRLLRD
jgi:hypothetical protein